MTDVVDDLEQILRSDLLSQLGPDLSGELASMSLAQVLIVYLNWRARLIPPCPRRAHLSAELQASAEYLQHRPIVDAITAKIEAGDDLTPHLSKGVRVAYEATLTRSPKNQRRSDLDLLVNEWGIHHLHLTTTLGADGFVERTDDLLFAICQPQDAFLIGIFPHGNWTRVDLATITVRNWEGAGVFQKSQTALRLAQPINEADRPGLRNAGVTTFLEIDGAVYMPPGQTTAGTATRATLDSNRIMHTFRALRAARTTRSGELDRATHDGGLPLNIEPRWEAFKRDGHYGLREITSDVFLAYLSIDG